jgi:hypothetical protein
MKDFKFKDDQTNVEKLYHYALHKFPKRHEDIEYDEVGQFVFYRKDKEVSIFYYINGSGHLCFNVYKNRVPTINKPIINDFRHRIYPEEKLRAIFDKLLRPLT